MPDSRFFITLPPLPVKEAVAIAGGEPRKCRSSILVRRVARLDEADISDAVIYFENDDARTKFGERAFGLCLAKSDPDRTLERWGVVACVENPRLAFAILAARLHASRGFDCVSPGVDAQASVSNEARIHPTAVIARGAEIGSGAGIGPHAVIGPGVKIGRGVQVESGASVTHAIIGDRTVILPGARIGQAGFGFVTTAEGMIRVPQLGRVIIGNDVEIGANTTIDRGALGDTQIGAGTKIDNQVQIGHNVRIGRNCVIVAHVGVSGSCVLGDRVILGGKVGLADHLVLGDDVMVGAGALIMRNIPAGEKWGGYPARPIRTWLRETAVLSRIAKQRRKTDQDNDEH